MDMTNAPRAHNPALPMSEKFESVIAPTEPQAPAGALGLGTGSRLFGVGAKTINLLRTAVEMGGVVASSHFGCGAARNKNRLPTVLRHRLAEWATPLNGVKTSELRVRITDKGHRLVFANKLDEERPAGRNS